MAEIKIPDILLHDCKNCQGLCCVALEHRIEEGFPLLADKPLGVPCQHLATSPEGSQVGIYKCMIHSHLLQAGWPTCKEFTCHGAGQAVSQFFKELGISWAEKPTEPDQVLKWEIQKTNMQIAYRVLNAALAILEKGLSGGWISVFVYFRALEVVKRVSLEFSTTLNTATSVIDEKFWNEQKFEAAIYTAMFG